MTPEAEEVTGARDRLIEKLGANSLDSDGAIRKCIADAAAAFNSDPPDFNESTTKVRIALESLARRAAAIIAVKASRAYPKDSWGCALQLFREVGIIDKDEGELLARVYTFISPGSACSRWELPMRNGLAWEEPSA